MSRVNRTITPDLGKRISEKMHAKNWNQSDLARASGLGRDSISTYIRGMVTPTQGNLKQIADALGCSTDELLPAEERQQETLFEIRQTGDGRVFVKINKAVSIKQAAAIFEILRDEK
jgi:transcriptional regulator with XRE-family HTH domain